MGVSPSAAEPEPADPPVRSVLAEELAEIDAARSRRKKAPDRSRVNESPRSCEPLPFDSKGDLTRAVKRELCGLALSGGGIRSATFNLGMVQALAELKLLSKVDYLSTVSGGGYIGSWLTAWIHRANEDTASPDYGVWKVESELRQAAPAADPAADKPMSRYEEKGPISFLREHSNYLTPRLGLFGADTWSAISTYLRNCVLNLTILIVALIPVILIPRLLFDLLQWVSKYQAAQLLAFVTLLGAAVMTGINLRYLRKGSAKAKPKPDSWEAWFPRQSAVLWMIVAPATAGAFFIAASMHESSTMSLPAFLALAVGYLALWWVLVRVWKPDGLPSVKVDASQSGAAAGTAPAGTWRRAYAEALLFAVLAALLAALMGRWLAGSSLTASAAKWMVAGLPIVVGIFSSSVVLHLGLMGRMVSEEVREWWSRLGGWLLIVALAWAAATALALFGPLLVDMAGAKIRVPATGAWLLTTVSGLLAGRSAATSGKESSWILRLATAIAPYVFILGLMLALAALADWGLSELFARAPIPDGDPWVDSTYHWDQLAVVPWESTFASMVLCATAAYGMSRRVDVNEFSLQPFYRNRLVRCYLGASNERAPHPFTGFDPADDIPLGKLARNDRALRPYPIVNVALNLVKGEKLAWQERKAASFTMSPLHCGFDDAYRRSNAYAGGTLTLGQAFATSGAAASPNMGYHSNPALAFLMTVFNVRLGMWLGNPKKKDSSCWMEAGPKWGLGALLSELFGLTSDTSNFVYLSDGGHFDNLGIYELVRRRCRYIIACDVGADPDVRFDDLGAVIRKCRTDFGIDVDLDTTSLQRDPKTGRCIYHCAVGKVRYPKGEHATLVYVKASLTGAESVDVLNYAAGDTSFPHQSTADQWFSESQFESYRQLGYHCGLTIFSAAARDEKHNTLEGMFTSLRERWYPSAATTEGAFTRHTTTLDSLHARLQGNSRLSFLDAQIFPSWQELMAGTFEKPPVQLWLPADADARRDGFYFCTALIQLMENVYTDLNLGRQYDHPDHRGWMNLFKHWSWCGMLRVTWAISAATYGARFQTFCRERLELGIGKVKVDDVEAEEKLNAVERARVEKNWSEGRKLYAIILRVEDPMRASETVYIDFTVGFAIVAGKDLAYLRVQDHLRKMGLAREALLALMSETRLRGVLELDRRTAEPEELIGIEVLKRLFESVQTELEERSADDQEA